MPETPEDKARKTIDDLLGKAGWLVQDRDKANVSAGRGVAIRSFPLKAGHGFADYLLYVDGQAAGVIEAKKEGEPLTTYEIQTAKYSEGLPDGLSASRPIGDRFHSATKAQASKRASRTFSIPTRAAARFSPFTNQRLLRNGSRTRQSLRARPFGPGFGRCLR
jgi:type I site-specific restriction endonuclease